jgi:hypothetical protein
VLSILIKRLGIGVGDGTRDGVGPADADRVVHPLAEGIGRLSGSRVMVVPGCGPGSDEGESFIPAPEPETEGEIAPWIFGASTVGITMIGLSPWRVSAVPANPIRATIIIPTAPITADRTEESALGVFLLGFRFFE